MAHIGFLGTGNMGIGMAARLLEAGHNVRVFNRTKIKAVPLIEKGAVFADTPRQAAEGADAIIAMVGDDAASRAVWLGDEGALAATPAKKSIIIECSTLSHDWVIELSGIVKGYGHSYLDCPVTGFPEAAASGELTLFLGGDKQTVSLAQPYLTPLSISQIHFGKIGAGTAYKLIVNLMGSIQIAAAAEGLLVAEKAGLDLDLVAKALGMGSSGSPQVTRNSKLMVEAKHDKNVRFNAYWRLKDTRYGVKFADKMGQQTPLGKVAKKIFQKLINAGHGKLAESKVIDILRD
jgi:3-hydroxyisobutyrate dehydrogenase